MVPPGSVRLMLWRAIIGAVIFLIVIGRCHYAAWAVSTEEAMNHLMA
jgi:hypothetical protein